MALYRTRINRALPARPAILQRRIPNTPRRELRASCLEAGEQECNGRAVFVRLSHAAILERSPSRAIDRHGDKIESRPNPMKIGSGEAAPFLRLRAGSISQVQPASPIL